MQLMQCTQCNALRLKRFEWIFIPYLTKKIAIKRYIKWFNENYCAYKINYKELQGGSFNVPILPISQEQ